ncbi:MAG: prepilin peptidase [Proteobacteria bacterium]|nr:prepilin peptidase [Pseudomonadota bacterium]
MLAQLEVLSTTTGAYVFVVVLGLLWGSFANVCIYRWPPSDEFPDGRSVVAPGSHCFVCKRDICWYDNVPLLAYLWLRGRCRFCETQFSPRYLIVEALTGALFGVAWWFAIALGPMRESFDVTLVRFVVSAAFCFVMVVIAFIDLDHKLILNKITMPSVVVFYAATFLLPERRWSEGLIGIAIGYGLPWLVGEIYFRVTRREGLGLGDSMLLAVIGALLGWKGVVVSLFGGSVLGSVIGITALLVGRARQAPATEPASPPEPEDPTTPEGTDADDDDPGIMRMELPFGPFLAMGALIYLFAEPWIHLYFALFG